MFVWHLFLDLKKMIKYEAGNPQESTEVHIQAGPSSINIQRLFEAHTTASKCKQRAVPKEIPKPPQQQMPQQQHRFRIPPIQEASDEHEDDIRAEQRPIRVKSADSARRTISRASVPKHNVADKKRQNQADKENIPIDNPSAQPAKSKMWIRPKEVPVRPKSGSQIARKPIRKTDPVSLYQAYQKDWAKFKSNICESSHSDLRWSIREKMMGINHR